MSPGTGSQCFPYIFASWWVDVIESLGATEGGLSRCDQGPGRYDRKVEGRRRGHFSFAFYPQCHDEPFSGPLPTEGDIGVFANASPQEDKRHIK